MPVKRQRVNAPHDSEQTPAKRVTTIITRSVTRSQPPPAAPPTPVTATLQSSCNPAAGVSQWAQLPTDLLALVFGFVSFRLALRLAFINRRLYALIAKHGEHRASHGSLWRTYPPIDFVVNESVRRRSEHKPATWDQLVQVGADKFTFRRRGVEFVASLLSALCEVSTLSLDIPRYKYDRGGCFNWSRTVVAYAVLPSLQQFTQLRMLVVRGIVGHQLGHLASLSIRSRR